LTDPIPFFIYVGTRPATQKVPLAYDLCGHVEIQDESGCVQLFGEVGCRDCFVVVDYSLVKIFFFDVEIL
jgi:hypothetical protein